MTCGCAKFHVNETHMQGFEIINIVHPADHHRPRTAVSNTHLHLTPRSPNMADKYILSVTAGPNYEDQKPIPINTPETTHISSSHLTANLQVRIQNYRGLPQGSPTTSPYFSPSGPHPHDLYSLQFSFALKESDIPGHDLVFGNDFDHPIRDKLPPGFNQAFNLVKWFVDPGLYGDVYADEPYLYGPMLSSINVLRVGPKDDKEQEKVEEVRANAEEGAALEEGGDGDGIDARQEMGVPGTAAARKKHFLTESNLHKFTFEKGREYSCDFFNPYLDFNGRAGPGSCMHCWHKLTDGQSSLSSSPAGA